ncbi:hypothetical protein Pmani_011331 [Petrolisthes manimaculis]|uniref:Uncharacterized protein n=1 Tax=Petrolisthes manimaculis TaxID=1843537 RepID=A0AAE1PZF9_9EUCA|nr:hypothetical protein Pmani_011331 [Petrolisthes manimaculis]
MSAAAGRKTLSQLYRQGWHEIPEVMASSYMALIGLGLSGIGAYLYVKKDGDNRRYRLKYTVYRHDDERVKKIRE